MSAIHTLLHFTWCLPQTLLGLILRGWGYEVRDEYQQSIFFGVKWLKHSLFSLGRHIFFPDPFYEFLIEEKTLLKHEVGHSRQSLILGPLYLFVIALPSLIWHVWYYSGKAKKCSYFKFFTEAWANRLAGIELK